MHENFQANFSSFDTRISDLTEDQQTLQQNLHKLERKIANVQFGGNSSTGGPGLDFLEHHWDEKLSYLRREVNHSSNGNLTKIREEIAYTSELFSKEIQNLR